MLGEERERVEKKPTHDIGAYEFYLKGRYYWDERSRDALEKAIKYFEAAIKMDPGFALAYSGLADSYRVLVDFGYLPPSEGNTSLGTILSVEWDWRGRKKSSSRR